MVPPAQKSTIWRVVSAWVAATCRLAAATACPRAPATVLLAALSHMLIKGFFFVQGLAMRLTFMRTEGPIPA